MLTYKYNINPSTGCKNCANVACDVFAIEEDFGRARVFNQRGNPELVQQAIDSWYVYMHNISHFYYCNLV
jgi:hypothetical protein